MSDSSPETSSGIVFWIKRLFIANRFPIVLKISLSICLLLIFAMAALSWAIYSKQERQIHDQLQAYGAVISDQLAATVKEALFSKSTFELELLLSNVADNEQILGAAVFDSTFKKIVGSGVLPNTADIDFSVVQQVLPFNRLRANQSPISQQEFQTFKQAILRLSPVNYRGVIGGYVMVLLPEESLKAVYKDAFQSVVVITLLLLVLIIPMAILISRQMSNPILSLLKATKSLGKNGGYRINEYRSDEIGQLIDSINSMGKDLLRKSEIEQRLEKLLSKDVARKIIKDLDTVSIGGEQTQATVLFADIVGFTSISEQLSPQQVSNFLNEYFEYLNRCCNFYFGSIDKYIGDCIMVVFGAHDKDQNQKYNAIACAIVMQRVLTELNELRVAEGKFSVQLRIGINCGDMLAGMIGSSERMEYTVVGDAVNLASRLCGEAEAGQIIVDESFYKCISSRHKLQVTEPRQIKVRGKQEIITIYQVKQIEFEQRQSVESLVDDLLSHRGQPT